MVAGSRRRAGGRGRSPPDVLGLSRLRTALFVGSEDCAAGGLVNRGLGTRYGAAAAGVAGGATRIEKARALYESLLALGAPVTLTEISGAGGISLPPPAPRPFRSGCAIGSPPQKKQVPPPDQQEKTMTRFSLIGGASALLLAHAGQAQTPPAGYPAKYAALIAQAKTEGSLLIYTNLSSLNLDPVVRAFNDAYPEIQVETIEMGPSEAFSRYDAETGTGVESADLIIANSITDWVRAVNAGTLDGYLSPERVNLPAWSIPRPASTPFRRILWSRSITSSPCQLICKPPRWRPISPTSERIPRSLRARLAPTTDAMRSGGAIGYAFAKYHGEEAWDWFASAGPMTRPGGGAGGMIERTDGGVGLLLLRLRACCPEPDGSGARAGSRLGLPLRWHARLFARHGDH